jgi:hypothetical protein
VVADRRVEGPHSCDDRVEEVFTRNAVPKRETKVYMLRATQTQIVRAKSPNFV